MPTQCFLACLVPAFSATELERMFQKKMSVRMFRHAFELFLCGHVVGCGLVSRMDMMRNTVRKGNL